MRVYDFQYYWSNNTLYYSLLWGSFKTNVGCLKPIFQRSHSPELYTLISTRFNVILINNNKTHTVAFNLVMYSIYVTYQIPCSSYWKEDNIWMWSTVAQTIFISIAQIWRKFFRYPISYHFLGPTMATCVCIFH
jgi:hypothetical protein